MFDIRQTLNATVLYDLPFGHGKAHSLSGPMDLVAGGWQAGGLINFRSGVPIDVLITRPDIAFVGQTGTPYAGQLYSAPFCLNGSTVGRNFPTGTAATTAVVDVPGAG